MALLGPHCRVGGGNAWVSILNGFLGGGVCFFMKRKDFQFQQLSITFKAHSIYIYINIVDARRMSPLTIYRYSLVC